MKIYQCPKCNTKYLEVALIRTKCSENEIGFYRIEYCPKCSNKRKPEFIKLHECKDIDKLLEELEEKQ